MNYFGCSGIPGQPNSFIEIMSEVKKNKYKNLGVTAVVLIVLYILLVTVLPNLSVWTRTCEFNAGKGMKRVSICSGDVYESSFEMPFDSIQGVDLYFEIEPGRIIGTADLIDPEGNSVLHKDITSAYDSDIASGNMPVRKGETYTLRVDLEYVETDELLNPSTVIVSGDDSQIVFGVRGHDNGSPMKWIFLVLYAFVGFLAIGTVWNLDKKNFRETRVFDILLIVVAVEFALLFLSQGHDLLSVAKSAFNMLDAFRHGHFFDYMDYSYIHEYDYPVADRLFVCDYNFLIVFPAAIVLLPVYIIYDGQAAYGSFYLSLWLILLMIVTFVMVRKLAAESGLGDRYRDDVVMLFASSSVVPFITVAFGQIDIFYVLFIVIAMRFYIRKKFRAFSLFMSLAITMKFFPILILIPLVLLAEKKIRYIILDVGIGISAKIITGYLFGSNPGYNAIVRMNSNNPEFVARLEDNKIGIFVVVFALICAYAYFSKADIGNKKEMLFKSMLLIFVSYGSFMVLVDWHSQWLIPLVMALCFLIPFYKENSKLVFMSILLEFMLILTGNLTEASMEMVNLGIFPGITGYEYSGVAMADVMNNISSLLMTLIPSALFAVVIATGVMLFKNRPRVEAEASKDLISYQCTHTWVMGRIWVLYAFTMFYLWCYWYV